MIQIIESTLGMELKEKQLKKIQLDPKLLRKLSENLSGYFINEFKLPHKAENILRPYIPLRDGLGQKISHTYLTQSSSPIYFEDAPFCY
ncbi:MAG: hypothetical protein IPK08_15775 [Bacteroidetes bacterium]|nr:hypothetical protein [Bacteroidota bacterium]